MRRSAQCVGNVGVGLAIVDDHRQGQLLGQPQVPVKCSALAIWRRVVSIVIQARFANRDHLGRASQLSDRREVLVRGRRGRIRMNADGRPCPGHPTSKLDGGATAGQVVADQHQRSHACRAGSCQNGVAIGVKSSIHQMCVRIH